MAPSRSPSKGIFRPRPRQKSCRPIPLPAPAASARLRKVVQLAQVQLHRLCRFHCRFRLLRDQVDRHYSRTRARGRVREKERKRSRNALRPLSSLKTRSRARKRTINRVRRCISLGHHSRPLLHYNFSRGFAVCLRFAEVYARRIKSGAGSFGYILGTLRSAVQRDLGRPRVGVLFSSRRLSLSGSRLSCRRIIYGVRLGG